MQSGSFVGDDRASKLMLMSEAIERLVPSGASLVLGTFIEQKTPFSAAHELIRQGRRDLELIGPVSDIVVDQLIGAGVVSRCRIAWGGHFTPRPLHCFQRAVAEETPLALEIDPYSFLTLSLALTAGALGVPYLPARVFIGAALERSGSAFRRYTPPVGTDPLLAVEAIRPDVAIIPVQRADVFGNSHTWGAHGLSIEAAHAARRVILVAEELVDEEVIRADPNRNIFPGLAIAAVVHEPWGCHPSPVQGAYRRDRRAYADYAEASATTAGFADWRARWVTSVEDRAAYVERLGAERLAELGVREHAPAPPVDYGF
jgi:glutaconate CoA-transferase subunit A